jgi:hypothetical protein
MASGSTARKKVRTAAAASSGWSPVGVDTLMTDTYRHERGWILTVTYNKNGQIETAAINRWEPAGNPSEKLAAVLKVLAEVK